MNTSYVPPGQPPRHPPRYIPTLTEVVQPPSTHPTAPATPGTAAPVAATGTPAEGPKMARAEADVLDLDLAAPGPAGRPLSLPSIQAPPLSSPPSSPPSLPHFLRAASGFAGEVAPAGQVRDPVRPGPSALFGAWSPPEVGPISARTSSTASFSAADEPAVGATATPAAAYVPSPEALLQQASDAFTRELQQQMTLWLTHWCERNAESWARQWAEAAAPMMREVMQTALRQALAQERPHSGKNPEGADMAHK